MLCILYVVLAMSIKIEGTSIYVIVVNSTLVFLFLSFTIPLVAAMLVYGTAKWPKPSSERITSLPGPKCLPSGPWRSTCCSTAR